MISPHSRVTWLSRSLHGLGGDIFSVFSWSPSPRAVGTIVTPTDCLPKQSMLVGPCGGRLPWEYLGVWGRPTTITGRGEVGFPSFPGDSLR